MSSDVQAARRQPLPTTARELLDLHPCRAPLTAEGEPLSFFACADVDADAAAVWPHVSDLARVNRAAGLAPIHAEERGGRLRGRRRHAGILHEFEDVEWEWSHGVWLAVTRRYDRGLLRAGRELFRVDPREGGARVYVCVSWVPRGPGGALALRVGGASTCRRLCRALATLAGEAVVAEPDATERAPAPPHLRREAPSSPQISERIASLAASIDRSSPAAVSGLAEYLQRADDIDLDRIRPLELATRWELAEDDAVRACLHATRAGLLEMSWDVLCPHCRGVRHRAPRLGELPQAASCEPCEVRFETHGAGAVEITFQAHPSIRRQEPIMYCSAEPARKPHMVLQQCLAAGERREVEARLRTGRYWARLVGAREGQPLRLDPRAGERLVWTASATREGRALEAAPSSSVVLVNDGDHPQTFVLEDESNLPRALRPADLFSHPEFRDLFSEEYLSAGVHLHVGEQTILFTDIVGSTEFYASRGDPDAFIEVVRHFEAIDERVREHGGAVVKTIGDAAMAAFADPVAALACSEALLRRFGPGRDDTPIRIRASINTGPCIAVRLNSNIDYFGTTVNLAAKLQAGAGAGQLALSEAVLAAPGVREFLRTRGARVAEVAIAHGDGVRAHRWEPFASEAGADAS